MAESEAQGIEKDNIVADGNLTAQNVAHVKTTTLLARWLFPSVEARGIERVLPSETRPLKWQSQLQASVLWVSINLAAVNITLGMLAPTLFELSFLDASLSAVFGSILGSCAVSYIATWGPKAGLRTMVSE